MKAVYKKLFNLQTKIGKITKDSVNPFFKSNYFDINKLIDVLKPILKEENLLLMQPLTVENNKPALQTLIVDVDSGEEITRTCPLPENPDPQKMGAIITYFRRYNLQSLLLLQAEDMDGNDTAPAVSKPKPATQAAKGNVISEPQRKRLFAISSKNGYTNEDVKEFLQEKYGLEHTSDILRECYDDICSHFEILKQGE